MKERHIYKEFELKGKIFIKKSFFEYSPEDLQVMDKFLDQALQKYVKDLKMFMLKNRIKLEYELEVKKSTDQNTNSKAEASKETIST